jgi:Na+/H+ antiporter NhaD/arsenite permease-like protein
MSSILFASVLGCIPVIVHLLRRQTVTPISWGAMQFLLETPLKVRRRRKIDNWLLMLIRIAILALLFSQVVSNVGATVMMVPMAINVALASGGNPAVYALLVAISTSNTFVIPSANPVILIVAGPGGYRSRDFLRVGLPLTLLMLVTTLVALNLVFGRG